MTADELIAAEVGRGIGIVATFNRLYYTVFAESDVAPVWESSADYTSWQGCLMETEYIFHISNQPPLSNLEKRRLKAEWSKIERDSALKDSSLGPAKVKAHRVDPNLKALGKDRKRPKRNR